MGCQAWIWLLPFSVRLWSSTNNVQVLHVPKVFFNFFKKFAVILYALLNDLLVDLSNQAAILCQQR